MANINVVSGDIFGSDADAILHQVNCCGVMGSGVARQVREKYPSVFNQYKAWCDEDKRRKTEQDYQKSALLGRVQVCYKDEYLAGRDEGTQVIVNLFAQDDYGYDGSCYTDYDALRECLNQVNLRFAGQKVAIPYMMACHRGGGDWNIVSEMIEDTLTDCDVTFYKYTAG